MNNRQIKTDRNVTEELINILLSENKIKSLSIDNAFNMFLDHMLVVNRIETHKYYEGRLKVLKMHLEMLKIYETKDITEDTFEQLIKICKLKNNKNVTINKNISALQYVLKYLRRKGIITNQKIEYIPLENDFQRFSIITPVQVEYLVSNLYLFSPKIQLIVRLILVTGIRRTELCNIKLKNIDLDEDSIYLDRTKTHDNRFIFFDNECKKLIKLQLLTSKVYLFENEKGIHKGEHMLPQYVSDVFKRIKKRLNFNGSLSAHVLRHTYATSLFENGADAESIRLLLGHKDYSMLKRYIHVKNKSLKQVCLSKGTLVATK